MDIFEVLLTRRSIRKFTEQAVTDAEVERLLEAAMAAPSAGNAQPWRFIVIRAQEHREAIAARHPYAQMAVHAPVCIAVCADTKSEKYAGYWPQDCAAALQNILLAARGLGIGTVWTGVHPDKEREVALKEYFRLPAHVEMLGIVVCGYPDQPFKKRDTFDKDKVYSEIWGDNTPL